MRSFLRQMSKGMLVAFFGLGLMIGIGLPAEAARCGCLCVDGTRGEGTVAGVCTSSSCTATCNTACTAHGGVTSNDCTADAPTPPPSTGALCACGCQDGSLNFTSAPGGSCSGGDSSCNSVCVTACASAGGAGTDNTCTTESSSVPTPGSCVQRALTRPGMSSSRRAAQEATVSRIERAAGGQPRTSWTCQSLPSDQIDNNHCVALGCEGTPFCCEPGTGSNPVTTGESGSSGGASEGTTGGAAAGSAPGACARLAVTRGTSQGTIDAIAQQTGTDPSVWTCQRVCAREQQSNCVQRGCPDTDSNVLCCPPSIGIPPGQTCGGRGASGSTTSGSGSGSGIGVARLILPECATTHDPRRAGKCQIADVFDLGYAAVRFMFGLSGALLLVAFVVSGFKYLVNGYAGDIKTAKETMVNATLGMIIMLFAYIVVTFLYTALTGSSGTDAPTTNTTPTNTSAPAPTNSSRTAPSTTAPPSGGTAGSCPSTDPRGTCRCAPSGVSSLLVRAATEEQVSQAQSACTSARSGATFDRSAFTCTGPATNCECRLVETELNRLLPTGVSASCTWSGS